MTLKYGLLGCSNIAQKSFFPVMSASKILEANFIGSRSIEKSKEWAEKYDVPNYGSYEDLCSSQGLNDKNLYQLLFLPFF